MVGRIFSAKALVVQISQFIRSNSVTTGATSKSTNCAVGGFTHRSPFCRMNSHHAGVTLQGQFAAATVSSRRGLPNHGIDARTAWSSNSVAANTRRPQSDVGARSSRSQRSSGQLASGPISAPDDTFADSPRQQFHGDQQAPPRNVARDQHQPPRERRHVTSRASPSRYQQEQAKLFERRQWRTDATRLHRESKFSVMQLFRYVPLTVFCYAKAPICGRTS